MLNKKERQIVQYLIQNKEHFTTSKELGEQLDCSDRTIRTYCKSIMEKLDGYQGLQLVSKQGYGYRLIVEDEEGLADFLKANRLPKSHLPNDETADADDRYNYLLNKLLFEQNEIYFDDLTSELFVSRSTLSNDFKKIRQRFAPYHLKVESKANKGVYVTGSERDKRRFIMDYFSDSGFISSMHTYVDDDFLNHSITFEELSIIVIDECREAELKLSDFVIQNLIIHIALAIRRLEAGFVIAKIEQSEAFADLPERRVAVRILERVAKAASMTFPSEEVDYITLHLISKSHSSWIVPQDSLSQLRFELIQALESIALPFSGDSQLLEGLLAHLSTLLLRLNGQITLENPLREEIQKHYQKSYYLAEKLMSALPAFSGYLLSADELSYIALHFMAASERYKERHDKYNILVICATGFGSAQMLKSRIENELGNIIHIKDVIGYYEINDDRLKDVDFIISSIDLSHLLFTIPVFTVSIFLNEDEVQMLRHEIAQLGEASSAVQESKAGDNSDIASVFDQYFSEKSFLILKDGHKDSVIKTLLEMMAEGEDQAFVGRMQELIRQREEMSSVVFSDTIAVPHPVKAAANHHRIGLAIVKNGLKWNSDYPHIQFVFLTSMSIHNNEGLTELAASIVDLVERPDLQAEMLACQSFEQFRKLFLMIKER
ncbi:BglG family transcription antiterminator [Streptococcus pantholopis]|uniref:Transcription antiterminator BglG n=1 Tax=Streptococcus pantholopis TaxID=1811193 RepID=A0A172QAJ0_9STRE|nr:PRD domain-containing protein [Streptococcus pantholopis]AND80425.1 transcription antiterminator BglG [Streptococcus pantholopis]